MKYVNLDKTVFNDDATQKALLNDVDFEEAQIISVEIVLKTRNIMTGQIASTVRPAQPVYNEVTHTSKISDRSPISPIQVYMVMKYGDMNFQVDEVCASNQNTLKQIELVLSQTNS
jgi:hypothetical protein